MCLNYKVFIFCIFIFNEAAHSQNLPYINYTTHNGLPQIQVRELFQDSEGYIWIGTKGGLAKFNGEKFEHFLPNEYILSIKQEPMGDVMVLTREGVYRYYRNEMKRIIKIEYPFILYCIKGRFWLYDHRKIHEYHNDTLFQSYDPLHEAPEDSINSLIYDHSTKKLIITTRKTKSAYLFYDGKMELLFQSFDGKLQVGEFVPGKKFYVVFNSHKYSFFDFETRKEYFHYTAVNNRIDKFFITHLPVKKYLIYEEFNYFSLDSLTNRSYLLDFQFIKAPWPVLYDRDHNFWIGSDNGLYQISNVPVKTYPKEFLNDVWTLIKGNDGYFYGAFYQKGLFKLDLEKQTKKEIISVNRGGYKDSAYYYGSSKDLKGNLYFPTHQGTVIYNYKSATNINSGISLISKYDPFSRQIIIGQENGIAFVDPDKNITVYKDSTRAAVNLHPTSIGFEPGGDIWVGTWQTLAKFNRITRNFIHVKENYKDYPDCGIISMTNDYKNNLWMGGTRGLWLLNTRKNEFVRIKDLEFNSYISSIASPDSSLLIIGTSFEIIFLNLKKYYDSGTIETRLYNFRNGFVAEETSQNGFYVDDSLLYVPSATVTSVIDFRKVSFTSDFFDVKITKINGIGLNHGEDIAEDFFSLKPKINRIEIEFETVGFALPTKCLFSYKLDGVDSDWIDWNEKQVVNYSNLSSGKYQFRVRAKSGSLIKGTSWKEDKINIKVSLPLYKEPYFLKLILIVVILLMSLIMYLIIVRNKLNLKNMHKDKQFKHLEIATLQSQLNPHFIFNSLSTLQILIDKNQPDTANNYLQKFSKLIRAYMESSIQTLEFVADEMKNPHFIKEEITLLKMYLDLEKMKYSDKKIQYSIHLQNENLLNKPIPPLLIQPFIENSIKHGLLPKDGLGKISIFFNENEDGYYCQILDDGIGIEKSRKISEKSIRPYTSRGINLVSKRVEILNNLGYKITIQVNQPEGGGTSVKIAFKDHYGK